MRVPPFYSTTKLLKQVPPLSLILADTTSLYSSILQPPKQTLRRLRPIDWDIATTLSQKPVILLRCILSRLESPEWPESPKFPWVLIFDDVVLISYFLLQKNSALQVNVNVEGFYVFFHYTIVPSQQYTYYTLGRPVQAWASSTSRRKYATRSGSH